MLADCVSSFWKHFDWFDFQEQHFLSLYCSCHIKHYFMLQNHCGIRTSICADNLAATGVRSHAFYNLVSCDFTLEAHGGNDRARRSRTCSGLRVLARGRTWGQSFINRWKTHLDAHVHTHTRTEAAVSLLLPVPGPSGSDYQTVCHSHD